MSAPKPLAIGADQQVAEALELAPRSRSIHPVMAIWTQRRAYLLAVAADGSQRFNLDGSVAGPVSEAHRLRARAMLTAGPGKKPQGDRSMPKLTATARKLKVTTLLDPVPFANLRVPEGAPRMELSVVVGNRRLTANLASKSVRKAVTMIGEYGLDGVALVLQGTLGAGDEILEAGLVAQAKAQKTTVPA